MLETWICARCGAQWQRARQSGRKPKYCHGCRAPRPPRHLECRRCGKSFVQHVTKCTIRRYCSPQCRSAAEHLRKRADGRYVEGLAKRRDKHVPIVHEGTCVECGSSFSAKRLGRKFCSRRCSSAAHHRRRKADGRARAMVEARRHVFTCRGCGQVNRGFGGTYCSNICQAEYEYGAVRGSRNTPWISPADRLAVYERDNWVCQICGDPVNRDAVFPDLDSATIDHRIPRARGGAHTMENWQTAHAYCNSVKGARNLCLIERTHEQVEVGIA